MLLYEHATNKFLLKDRIGLDLDEFSNKFYRSLQLYNQKCDKELFDNFLKELYMKEPADYQKWYKTFTKIPYSFVRKNVSLITTLINNDNVDYAIVSYDMYKKKRSLISRCIPRKATVSTVGESKEELLIELNMQLAALDSELEDNILRKAQEDFYICFGQYENDPYLGEFYNNILDSFEIEIRNSIVDEIIKIDGVNAKILDDISDTISHDDMQHNKKNHRVATMFKQTRK